MRRVFWTLCRPNPDLKKRQKAAETLKPALWMIPAQPHERNFAAKAMLYAGENESCIANTGRMGAKRPQKHDGSLACEGGGQATRRGVSSSY